MKKRVRRSLARSLRMSASAAMITAGIVALRHMLETPQPLKSALPGEELLYVWRKRSIFYKVLGDVEAPPLVLLHTPDIGASAHEMRHLLEPLARTHRVYAPDLPGFGLSDRPAIDYSAALYSDFCQDFVQEVVRRPATLVASGLSCNYAVTMAANAPDLCTDLVLISPLALQGDAGQSSFWRAFAQLPICKALLYPLLSTRLAFLFTHASLNREADYAHFHATTHQLGAEHAAMALLAGKLIKDSSCEFAALSQPVLLIWGTQALEHQRHLADLQEISQLRRARAVELIQGGGLAVHEEQSEDVAFAIQRWQQQMETRLEDATPLAIPDPAPVAALYRVEPPSSEANAASLELATQVNVPFQEQEAGATTEEIPQSPGILAYCVKCKQKTEMLDASEFTMKNGRLAVRGTCAVCGASLTRIGGKK